MRERRIGLLGSSVLGALAGIALIFGAHHNSTLPVDPSAPAPATVVHARAVSAVALTIPTVGIRARIIGLGLTRSGSLAVPAMNQAGMAGWYVGSATPGDVGSAVIVGHVDSMSGPAVFYHLSSVRRGSQIDVTRSDGRTASYLVTAVQVFAKAHFPTAAVYAPTRDATLRLITCSPPYDPGHGGYQDNMIVFARLRNLSTPVRGAS